MDPKTKQQAAAAPPGHQLVVLLDINPHQKKVLPLELTVAEGVIQKLDQPENVFTVITLGSDSPTLLKSGVQANEAIAAIRDVGLGKPTEGCLCIQLYDALNLAWHLFIDDARPKSLLAITEGIDYARGKTFKQAVSRAQQLQVSCDVALVADHPFQGSKSIQKYGFYLRRLAGKTHGRYIEVGREQIKVPRSVDRLTESIRDQGSGDKEASQ